MARPATPGQAPVEGAPAPSRAARVQQRARAAFHRVVDALDRRRVFLAAVIVLTLVAFLVRAPHAVESREIEGEGLGDAQVYYWHAKNFASGAFPSQFHRSDGWSFFMAVALTAWGQDPFIIYGDPGPEDVWNKAVVNLFTAAIGASLVPATVLFGRLLLSRRASLAAATFVAFDPLLLFDSTRAMSEPAFALTLTLAAAAILLARRHPGWLVAAGALAAVGHTLRINGLLLAVALLAFAAYDLPRAAAGRHRRWHLALFLAAFVVVSAPYDVWRTVQNGSMFEYGTNSRLWADDLWDFEDPYWDGAPKETFGDYVATHTFGDFVHRLTCGFALVTYDFLGGMPGYRIEPCTLTYPQQDTGEIAVNPVLLVCLAAAALWVRDRSLGLSVFLLVVTLATLAWMYPLTRSVRYFSPFLPLLIVTGIAGLAHAARHSRAPLATAATVVGVYLLLFAVRPLLAIADWAGVLRAHPGLWSPALQMLLLLGLFAWGAVRLAERSGPVAPAPPAGGVEPPMEAREPRSDAPTP